MSSIFLCHNSKDKPWVRTLAGRLTADGVVVWIDEAELNIGDSLLEKIASGIKEMQYVAAVISPNSIASAWVQKELQLAMSKEMSSRTVTVLPLLIEKCEVPAFLTDKLYADFTDPDNYEREYQRLLRAIGITATAKTRESEPVSSQQPRNPSRANSAEGLRIVGVEKDRTRQDPDYAGLQDYFFKLSQRPPAGWEKFFNEARSFPRHSMWRKAWIEGDCVVIKCALDEIERYHLEDLKKDVATANSKYEEVSQLHEQQRLHREEEERRRRQERDQKLDDLDFD